MLPETLPPGGRAAAPLGEAAGGSARLLQYVYIYSIHIYIYIYIRIIYIYIYIYIYAYNIYIYIYTIVSSRRGQSEGAGGSPAMPLAVLEPGPAGYYILILMGVTVALHTELPSPHIVYLILVRLQLQ